MALFGPFAQIRERLVFGVAKDFSGGRRAARRARGFLS
jgi:hypothetical protein